MIRTNGGRAAALHNGLGAVIIADASRCLSQVGGALRGRRTGEQAAVKLESFGGWRKVFIFAMVFSVANYVDTITTRNSWHAFAGWRGCNA